MKKQEQEENIFKTVILAYPGMTMLDAVGPSEVLTNSPYFDVEWIGTHQGAFSNDANSFNIEGIRHFSELSDTENTSIDILLVPGGPGEKAIMANQEVLSWIKTIDEHTLRTTSVCTGSLILAKAGLLNGQRACTHWACLGELADLGAIPIRDRFIQSGKYVSSSGVSAGIDMALYLLKSLVSKKHARDLRFGIEYFPQQFQLVSSYSLPMFMLKKLSKRFQQYYVNARQKFL